MTGQEATIEDVSPEIQRLARRDLVLLQQFTQAMIADDAVGDEVPNGVTLVLLPDDDTELADLNLREAVDAARRGMNVYIRQLYRVGNEVDERGEPLYSPYPGGKKAAANE